MGFGTPGSKRIIPACLKAMEPAGVSLLWSRGMRDGCCTCCVWGWAATASHSAPWLCGSGHVPAAAETQLALWDGLLEAVLGCLMNHKPPQERWTC